MAYFSVGSVKPTNPLFVLRIFCCMYPVVFLLYDFVSCSRIAYLWDDKCSRQNNEKNNIPGQLKSRSFLDILIYVKVLFFLFVFVLHKCHENLVIFFWFYSLWLMIGEGLSEMQTRPGLWLADGKRARTGSTNHVTPFWSYGVVFCGGENLTLWSDCSYFVMYIPDIFITNTG